MRELLSGFIAVAFVFSAGYAQAQLQSDEQQACINAINKDASKVSGAQAKLQGSCIKGASTGKVDDADVCIGADEKGIVDKAVAKTTDDETALCTSLPSFAYTSALSANAAAVQQRYGLLTDLLGTPVDAAVASKEAAPELAACQSKLLKSIDKLLSTQLKVFNSCKKGALATVTDATGLETTCYAALVASEEDGSVAKAIDKVGAARTKSCQDAQLASAFPGGCSATMGSAFDACAEVLASCRACRTLNQMDGLARDCDDFDDGSSNLSCKADCIYVSSSLGSSIGSGAPDDPLDTINNGIFKALTDGIEEVCVSGESYAEQVAMESGITVRGGYDHGSPFFSFAPAEVTTTVTASGSVFLASTIDAATSIEHVTIVAQTPGTGGASTYGVLLLGGAGELTVSNVAIMAQAGAAGTPGADGTPFGAPAIAGPDGGDGCSNCGGVGQGGVAPVCAEPGGKGGNGGNGSSSGQTGSPGSGGAAGGAGDASNTCFGSVEVADGGDDGANGEPGAPGTGGGSLGAISAGYLPADGESGEDGTNGKGGGGGGGGGGGENAGGICNNDGGGGGGAGGCGGLAGNMGGGGGGGGGSFGVFVAAGTASVEDSDITTAAGGVGGAGGDGGSGQIGGNGGPGGSGADDSDSGGPGGIGGDGGHGGPGGGGGGGPSACIARASSASVTTMNLDCTTAAPGLGGDGGTNMGGGVGAPGAAGSAGTHLVIP